MPYTAHIRVGSLSFSLTCIAMRDAAGNFIGPALQWEDVTEQLDGQQQVEKLIANASSGKLDERIDTERYSGFMAQLGDGINQLLDSVVDPVNQCIDVMSRVSEGNLNTCMPEEYDGDFARLSEAVNTSIMNIRQMVEKITVSAAKVANASGEIAEGNDDLSKRTEDQAASLQETSASMEQMSGTVKQNATSAKEANQLADNATDKAKRGGNVVKNTVSAMAEINDASKKIADIIGVIDEIAFQTNLLALNAAVEAAGPGSRDEALLWLPVRCETWLSEVPVLPRKSKTLSKTVLPRWLKVRGWWMNPGTCWKKLSLP